jgi:hypothetical protein
MKSLEPGTRGGATPIVISARPEWHCFQKLAQVRGYVSLCQRRENALVLGQQIARPEARLRCSECDGLEMARRGWDGSGPVSPRRAGSFSRCRWWPRVANPTTMPVQPPLLA